MDPSSAARRNVAFVLGAGVNGLAVIRSLGRAAVPVVAFYRRPAEIGRLSRYCTAVRLPEGAWGSELTDRVTREAEGLDARPVLLPTTDAYAQWLNDDQERLEGSFLFHDNEKDVFRSLNSKLGIISLVEEHDLPAPWAHHFHALDDFQAEARRFPMPVIVKPVDTFSRLLPGGEKNLLFGDVDSLVRYVTDHEDHLPDMVFQEVVRGGDGAILICTLLLDRDGRPVMWYTGRKIRQYPPDYGVTTFGVSEIDEELARRSAEFMGAVGYRGVCTLEFAERRDTGNRLFLEVNLRSYYHNQLFYDCGLNFPLADYELLTGESPGSIAGLRREGLHWLDFNRDLGSFFRKRRDDDLGAVEWLRSLTAARSFAAFAFDDPKPWLRRFLDLLRMLAGKAGLRGAGG